MRGNSLEGTEIYCVGNSSDFSSVNDEEDRMINDMFIITGVNPEKFRRFMDDQDTVNILDDKKENSLKLEVLDYYPDDRPISSLAYLQGIEKVCLPDAETFIIELKGHHIKPKSFTKKNNQKYYNDSNNLVHSSKTLGLLNPELHKQVVGRGIHRR